MSVTDEKDLWKGTPMIFKKDGSPKWRYQLEPFRCALEVSEMSLAEVERKAGISDSSLTRLLGYRKQTGGWRRAKGGKLVRYAYYATSISYDNAVKLARVLEMDFKELGL